MTAFYLGQRVRKARGELCVGWTGTVAGVDPMDPRGLGVRMDIGGLGISHRDRPRAFGAGEILWGYPDEFEPITPDGMEPITETLALWLPEGQHA
jgi:hypothetical protein